MPAPPIVPNTQDQGVSEEAYTYLQQYIHRESGIALGRDKAYLLRCRLQPIIDQERLASIDDLCRRLQQSPTDALRRRVVESMTTHETFFFRAFPVYAMRR